MQSKFKPPLSPNPEQQPVIQAIYDHLNQLVDAVNQGTDKTSPRHSEGKPGDLRLVKGGDGDFYLQGRFEEGWVGTVRGALKFQAREGDTPRSSDVIDQTGATIIRNVLESPVLDTSAFGGGGGGEANTASNLGGGLANFSTKVGVDLRFNSFAAADFNLASNLISIDYTNGQAASGSTKGFLTSTDWTTFNNKQNAITPAALTKTDDTNVTLTLGGTPATALLQATSLTLGWTGTLAVARGGTGVGSLSNIVGTTNQITVSGGTGRVIGGNVTLSLPQDINATATVIFGNVLTPGHVGITDVHADFSGGNFVIDGTGSGAGFYLQNLDGYVADGFLYWDMATGVVAPASLGAAGEELLLGNDTNVTLTGGGAISSCLLAEASISLGWTGTLAAGRLNSNVVQSVVNDTNVTGSISAQALTLGWTGQLAETRGGTAQSTYTLGDLLYASASNTLSKLAGNTTSTKKFLRQTGTGAVSAAPAWDTVLAADVGSGAALTKTDDTNVTLTLGGTPTTSLLAATSLTLGWTGQLGLTRGGTAASLTASNGGIVYSTGSALAILSGTATAGLALISGASTTPSWYAPTAGSVLFAGTSGILQQDNSNLFWDDSNNRLGILTNAPTASLSVAEKFLISSAGLATKYNNIALVAGGVPSIVAQVNLTGRTASISATTMYTAPAVDGLYLMLYTATVTTAATTSSTLGGTNGFQATYTNADDSTVVTTPRHDAPSAGTNRAYGGSKNQQNTVGTSISGAIVLYAKASTNIQYGIEYTSSGGTAMVYSLHIQLLAL